MLQAVQQQEILPRMRITEEELRQYYAGHREIHDAGDGHSARDHRASCPVRRRAGQNPRPAGGDSRRQGQDRRRSRDARLPAKTSPPSSRSSPSRRRRPTAAGRPGERRGHQSRAQGRDLDKLKPGEITEPIQLRPRGYRDLQARDARRRPPLSRSTACATRFEQAHPRRAARRRDEEAAGAAPRAGRHRVEGRHAQGRSTRDARRRRRRRQ